MTDTDPDIAPDAGASGNASAPPNGHAAEAKERTAVPAATGASVVNAPYTVVPEDTGTKTAEIEIAIDYAIIQLFSEHLYGSPNKAIEELVANAFDALASKVDVWVPGPEVDDVVLVWDDGRSMDIDGLKSLWAIARSPKAKVADRRVEGEVNGHKLVRNMIGKFGIGKLASYAVGDDITHYCRTADGDYLVVTIDYPTVLSEERDSTQAYRSPVIRLSAEEMAASVRKLFTNPPADLDALLARPSWTLVRIGRLRDGVDFKVGRLRWIIGNGMPLQPDFEIDINGDKVVSKLGTNADQEWDLSALQLTTVVASVWQDEVRAGDISGALLIGPAMSGALPEPLKSGDPTIWVETSEEINDKTVRFPHLGDVKVVMRMFKESLLSKEDRPRTHGFFVMVRGRLVNSEDELLFLNDPSYATFYRTQYVIEADALDDQLLADRERLRTSTPAAQELRILQVALNRAARRYFDEADKADEASANPVSLLPLDNRELFRQPLTALLMARDELADQGSDFSEPEVRRGNYTVDAPLSDLDADGGNFLVNEDHPLFQVFRTQAGGGKKAAKFMRLFDVFAVAERLVEGHLYDTGMSAEQVEEVADWRDRLLRVLATRYSLAGEAVVEEVKQESYKGNAGFEKALAKLFELMGFRATRDGRSGQKDVLTVAPIGPEHYSFTVEAKGSKHPIANDDADISSAAAHRDAANADHAIVVAREFAGFTQDTGEPPAVLKECASTGGVSIVTLSTLITLYEAMQQFSYPLDVILPVLREIESPYAKSKRVAELNDPLEKLDYRAILDEVWKQQQGVAEGDRVSWRPIWQKSYRHMPADDFQARLYALEGLAGGLVVLATGETIFLRQSPNKIAERIARAVGVDPDGDVADGDVEPPDGYAAAP